MGLERNMINGDRTYVKVLDVVYSDGNALITTLVHNNREVNEYTLGEYVYSSVTEPTIEEAYEYIKTLPEFEGYYNC